MGRFNLQTDMRRPVILLALLATAAVPTAAPAAAQSGSEAYVVQATSALGTSTGVALGATALGSVEALAAVLPDLAPGTNAVVLTQTGSDNTLFVEQTGLDNVAALEQFGSGNLTRLLQDGSRNVVAATVLGDDNVLTVNQVGDDNAYALVMVGTNPEHLVEQIGDGNQARQIVAPGLAAAGIEQRGNGLDVLVERY